MEQKIIKIDTELSDNDKLQILNNITCSTYFETNCSICKKSFKRRKDQLKRMGPKSIFLCSDCARTMAWQSKTEEEKLKIKEQRIKTNTELYGGIGFASKTLADKVKASLEDTYGKGFDNPQKIQEIKNKTKKTNIEKYGGTGFASKELLEKGRDTCEKLYGYRNIQEDPRILAKRIQTMNERYGVDFAAQNNDIRKKQIATNIERYGGPSALCDPNVLKKSMDTQIQKYGKLAFIGTHSSYIYNDILFDSSWELAFYIYHLSLGHNIIREPYSIPYVDSLGKEHMYYPDFIMDNVLYEIKNDALLNENNIILDRNTFSITEKTLAKTQCIRDNNVIILKSADLRDCFSYMESKFGKNWKEKFKRK